MSQKWKGDINVVFTTICKVDFDVGQNAYKQFFNYFS